VKITGWKIDVKNESATKQQEEGPMALVVLPGVSEDLAKRLFGGGIKSVAMVAAADADMLMKASGVDESKALQLIGAAGAMLDEAASAAGKAAKGTTR
jgi:ERCC4-type nuclease